MAAILVDPIFREAFGVIKNLNAVTLDERIKTDRLLEKRKNEYDDDRNVVEKQINTVQASNKRYYDDGGDGVGETYIPENENYVRNENLNKKSFDDFFKAKATIIPLLVTFVFIQKKQNDFMYKVLAFFLLIVHLTLIGAFSMTSSNNNVKNY